jgi:hypothetical protein
MAASDEWLRTKPSYGVLKIEKENEWVRATSGCEQDQDQITVSLK